MLNILSLNLERVNARVSMSQKNAGWERKGVLSTRSYET